MSSEPKNHHPHTPAHKHFGRRLKTMRQKFQESLGETSGAVEIDVELLDRYERGSELPSEDVLMLLISHFGLQDDEAVELWELAGYDAETGFSTDRNAGAHANHHVDDTQNRQAAVQAGPIMLLAFDNRVLYSSDAEIATDESGVVLNFMQNAHPTDTFADSKADGSNQRYPVSRIGMTHEQAEKLVHDLQQALLRKKYTSGPKQLPPPQQP